MAKGEKLPFDIDEVMRRIRAAVADVPDAAMFALRDLGYGTLFQQLVACIISIRTTDEVSLPDGARAARAGADAERTSPKLDVREIDAAIRSASFHEPKAAQIHAIARRARGGVRRRASRGRGGAAVVPPASAPSARTSRSASRATCRASAWTCTCTASTNRWGYVSARTPEETMRGARARAAEEVLDRDQPAARAVRKAHLHGGPAEVLDVSRARVLPAGGSDGAPVSALVLRRRSLRRAVLLPPFFAADLRAPFLRRARAVQGATIIPAER